jgi:hypothetical protein
MKPEARFLGMAKSFWASVRTISQHTGYTVRGKGEILVPSTSDMMRAMEENNLSPSGIARADGALTELGNRLSDYFRYRADVLNTYVEPRLMDAARAKTEFRRLRGRFRAACPQPMNKQTGAKKAEAYLTCLVNILIQANAGGLPCDYDPRSLTTVTRHGAPLRTLARRVDGAFPSTVNPIAVWEIKEYYYTTTFGSRVADGVYETLLDGMELAEIKEQEGIRVLHYLFVDSHYTWWKCGRSYLCRIIDTLHMGYVDEVLFGYEVIEQLPRIVSEWVRLAGQRSRNH